MVQQRLRNMNAADKPRVSFSIDLGELIHAALGGVVFIIACVGMGFMHFKAAEALGSKHVEAARALGSKHVQAAESHGASSERAQADAL